MALIMLGVLCGKGRFSEAATLAFGCFAVGILVLRRELRFVLLGLVMPIYGAVGVPPIAVAVLRFSLVGVIILMDLGALRLRRYRMPGWQWWAYGLALMVAAIAQASVGGAYLAFSFAVAAVLGGRIAADPPALGLFLAGFRAGVVVSSVALLTNALNILDLSLVVQGAGYAGLSSRSTAFSYEAAFALIAWYWMTPSQRRRGWRRMTWLAEGLTVSMALIASGGRGGLVALIVALVALPISAGRLKVAFRFVVCGLGGVAVGLLVGIPTPSIDRLFPQPNDRRVSVEDQYGSGRLDAYQRGVEVARENLLLGGGFDAASLGGTGNGRDSRSETTQTQVSHQLVLALVIAGGVGLAAAALALLFDAGRSAYWLMRRHEKNGWWLAAATVTFLVSSLLEIGGGLLGFQSVLLFSIVCFSMRATLSSDRNRTITVL